MNYLRFYLNHFRMELPHYKIIHPKKPLKVLVKSNVSIILVSI